MPFFIRQVIPTFDTPPITLTITGSFNEALLTHFQNFCELFILLFLQLSCFSYNYDLNPIPGLTNLLNPTSGLKSPKVNSGELSNLSQQHKVKRVLASRRMPYSP